ITQTRSVIGRTRDQRATVRSLGLKRIRHTVVQPDRPEIRGMLRKIPHLVEFEVVDADAATSTDADAVAAKKASAKKAAKKSTAKKTAKKTAAKKTAAKKTAKKSAAKKTAEKTASAADAPEASTDDAAEESTS